MRAIRKTAFMIMFSTVAFLTSAATDARAQLLIKNDERSCKLSIDGEEIATMKANGVYRANIGIGEHLLEAVSLDGYYKTEQTVKVENSQQQVVKLSLTPDYEKLIRAAYEGKFIVTMAKEGSLWSDTGCYNLDHDLGDIPSGAIVKIINPQRLTCTLKDLGGARIEYKGHVGWMFELYLNFTTSSSEAGETLKAEASRQKSEQQAEADRRQSLINKWGGYWSGEYEHVEGDNLWVTYELLAITITDDGKCTLDRKVGVYSGGLESESAKRDRARTDARSDDTRDCELKDSGPEGFLNQGPWKARISYAGVELTFTPSLQWGKTVTIRLRHQ
jgi:hypothetical protein